jgi:hypothetical protein
MSSAACLRSTAGHGRSAATHSEHRPPVEDLGAVSFGDYARRGFVDGIRIRLPTSPGSSWAASPRSRGRDCWVLAFVDEWEWEAQRLARLAPATEQEP